MKPINAKYERGAALLALLAVIMLGASWFLVSQLNSESGGLTAVKRNRNAEVLNQAKLALIGYVAQQAATTGENNPGRLPCPEAVNSIGTFDEGTSAPRPSAPITTTCLSIGRLPWRTLGLDKLVDAAGEPLWYVVGPSWRLTDSNSTLLINSNTPAGNITVDGQQTVALIVAPGAAMNVQAATGCTAHNQVRTAPSPTMVALNYIECFNSGTLQFVTTASSTSFNDQAVRITVADIMPAIEAAIAQRIEREIVPVLKAAYVGTKWNTLAGDTVFPFAAPFLPLGPGTSSPGSSSYVGAASTQGLLPFSYSPPCSPVGDPRCTSSTFHAWGTPTLSKVSGSGSLYLSPSCSVSGSLITCTGYYQSGSLQASFDDPVSNVANALRDFNLADHTVTVWTNLCVNPCGAPDWDGYQIETSTRSRRFNSSGSLSFVVRTPFRWTAGKNYGYYYIQAQRPVITDHALLSTSTGSSTGWFARNEWYRLLYYAIAPNHAPGGSLTCSGASCLTVTNLSPATDKRALLILAGRLLPSQALAGGLRPSSNLAYYLEDAINRDGDLTYIKATPGATVNDRFVIVDKN